MPDSSSLSSLISLLEAERARDSISPARLAAIYRALQTYSDECDAEIIKSISDKEKAIKELISAEASARESADSAEAEARAAAVAAEASARKNADASERTARENADDNLASLIQQEASNRTSAVYSEAYARQSADAALSSEIQKVLKEIPDVTGFITKSQADTAYQPIALRIVELSGHTVLPRAVDKTGQWRELGFKDGILFDKQAFSIGINKEALFNAPEESPSYEFSFWLLDKDKQWYPFDFRSDHFSLGGPSNSILSISSEYAKDCLRAAINQMPEVNLDVVAKALNKSPVTVFSTKELLTYIQELGLTPFVGQRFVCAYNKTTPAKYYLKYSDCQNFEAYASATDYLTAPPSDGCLYGYKNGEWVKITESGQKILGISEAAIAQSAAAFSGADQSEALSAGSEEETGADQSEAVPAIGSAENVPDQREAVSAGVDEEAIPDQREAVSASGSAENDVEHNNTEEHE